MNNPPTQPPTLPTIIKDGTKKEEEKGGGGTGAKPTKGWITNLAKAPVPELRTSLYRYLSGLEPVIPESQLQQTKQTIEQFLNHKTKQKLLKLNPDDPDVEMEISDGERLQKFLVEQYAPTCDNWVTKFWLDEMYMSNQLPLVVNSNPFFMLPLQKFKSTSEHLHFASLMVQFSLNFKHKIDCQTLPQDTIRNSKPMCMQTYKNFFHYCRIPGLEKDEPFVTPPTNTNCHFIVAAFNQFTVVHLDNNRIPSVDELERCLMKIWNNSKTKAGLTEMIGLLTTENRKTWAAIRQNMMSDAQNSESLRMMETCLFVLCLDDFVMQKPSTGSGGGGGVGTRAGGYRNSIQMAKMDASYMGWMMLHGGGSDLHTANRWFDKFLQIIVSREGICGIVVEHSGSEGITVLNFLEQFIKQTLREDEDKLNKKQLIRQSTIEMQDLPSKMQVKTLMWNVDAQLQKCIKQAEKQVDKLISDLSMYVLKFSEFGREFIKQQRISPDVFIQLALQLTYYKLHRCICSTYESCSLRQFTMGRVDNIRASQIEAKDWVEVMCATETNTATNTTTPATSTNGSAKTDQNNQEQDDDDDEQHQQKKINLFKRAIEKQTKVMEYTSNGLGPDNHLVALRELSKLYDDGQVPQIFKEKSYKEYINYRLSTSQLFTNEDILVGYGPVVPDGYGCSYNPQAEHITFCVTSFHSSTSPPTSSDFFALSLEGSLLQMRELCLKMNKHSTTSNNNNKPSK